MKYVIAGDYSEFEQWIIKNNHSLFDYTYVYDVEVFREEQHPKGIFTGSYRNREDIVRIVEILLSKLPHNKDGKYTKLWNLYYELRDKKNPSTAVGITINIGHPGSGSGILGGSGTVYSVDHPGSGGTGVGRVYNLINLGSVK